MTFRPVNTRTCIRASHSITLTHNRIHAHASPGLPMMTGLIEQNRTVGVPTQIPVTPVTNPRRASLAALGSERSGGGGASHPHPCPPPSRPRRRLSCATFVPNRLPWRTPSGTDGLHQPAARVRAEAFAGQERARSDHLGSLERRLATSPTTGPDRRLCCGVCPAPLLISPPARMWTTCAM